MAGAIINLGSWIARLGIPVGALYSSTKGATTGRRRGFRALSLEQRGGETPAAEGILGKSVLETPQPVVDGAEDR